MLLKTETTAAAVVRVLVTKMPRRPGQMVTGTETAHRGGTRGVNRRLPRCTCPFKSNSSRSSRRLEPVLQPGVRHPSGIRHLTLRTGHFG